MRGRGSAGRGARVRAFVVALVVVVVDAAAACGAPKVALADLQPVDARIKDVQIFDGGLGLGELAVGGGNLEMDEADGALWRAPVRLTSGGVGMLMDLALEQGTFAMDLSLGPPKTGADLVGGYDGGRYALALTVGAGWYDLENDHHVALTAQTFEESIVSAYAGHVWLGVDVDGEITLR